MLDKDSMQKKRELNAKQLKKQTKCVMKLERRVHTFLPPPLTSAVEPADASALSDCQTAALCGCGSKTFVNINTQVIIIKHTYLI